MTQYTALFLIVAVGSSALVQIFTDPRITRKFISRSLIAIAVFAAHAAIGMLVIFFLLPWGPRAALGVTAAFLGWIGLGTLGLIRFAPRLRTPPAFLLRVGAADLVCLLLIGFGIVSAIGLVG